MLFALIISYHLEKMKKVKPTFASYSRKIIVYNLIVILLINHIFCSIKTIEYYMKTKYSCISVFQYYFIMF